VDPQLLEQHSANLRVEPDGKVRFEPTAPIGSPVLPRSAADVILPSQSNGTSAQADYWQGSKTGNTYPSLASMRTVGEPVPGDPTSSFGQAGVDGGAREALETFLKSRVLTQEDATRPQDLVAKARGKAKLAELLWILRPLVYGKLARRRLCVPAPANVGHCRPAQSWPCASTAGATRSLTWSHFLSSTSPTRCVPRLPLSARHPRARSSRRRRPSGGARSCGISCAGRCGTPSQSKQTARGRHTTN